jgi:hypothetical protein
VTRIRRGGYVLFTWVGDHPPRHVHVLRNGRLVVKWNLEEGRSMEGYASADIVRLLRQLEDEGLL